MCGIVGIVHRDPDRSVSADVIRGMCRAMRHRGPDEEGTFVAGHVGLGMRRLSIIDLAGGQQPMSNEDGSKTIVYNGEIYNYRELRRGLLDRGHRFTTESDTETVVHLYEERGPAAVERLRGMFAFAIWDSGDHSLVLARDRFGIKPLYYVTAPWGIAFASELKVLVAAGMTNRELDWEALDAYLQLGYVPAPSTPFRDVRKLEQGHWLRWREDGEIEMHRYWDLPRGHSPAPQDVERSVVEWIDDAVTAHLVSDVPVAAFLSGGLDSSAVVASMALVPGGAPPHAFTARYAGSGAKAADESELARALAARYGTELTVVDISPAVQDIFEPIIHALDEPHADDSAIPTWTLSQAVGSAYKVALTGIGGDELFAGYRRHLGLTALERFARLPLALRRAAANFAWHLPDLSGGLGIDRAKRFLRASAAGGSTPELYLQMISRMADAERASCYAPHLRSEISGALAGERFRKLYGEGGSPHGLSAALYFDYHTYLADDILALSDRLSMAHSLEIRVPFVDHVLVEHVFPLPASLKAGVGAPKALLKRSLAQRLPQAHLTAPKRGFVGPTSAWMRNELRPMLEDELSSARLSRLGYFDAKVVTGLLRDHFDRRHNREGILWALLCFSTWHRLYVETVGVRPYSRMGGGHEISPLVA
jgi:asparagine synthase (glutamine-hydrolysing)